MMDRVEERRGLVPFPVSKVGEKIASALSMPMPVAPDWSPKQAREVARRVTEECTHVK